MVNVGGKNFSDAHIHPLSGFATTQTHTFHHTQLTCLISSSELSSLTGARIWLPLVPNNLGNAKSRQARISDSDGGNEES